MVTNLESIRLQQFVYKVQAEFQKHGFLCTCKQQRHICVYINVCLTPLTHPLTVVEP